MNQLVLKVMGTCILKLESKFNVLVKSLNVPPGIIPTGNCKSCCMTPFTSSLTVPSPPKINNISISEPYLSFLIDSQYLIMSPSFSLN